MGDPQLDALIDEALANNRDLKVATARVDEFAAILAGTRAQASLVRHLIDALDDLGRFAHVDPATTDASTIVQGVEMVEKKLLKTLSGAGLQVLDPVGEPFDPTHHEAVATEPTANKSEDHVVARVYQRGYTFGGQLLRPARVVVKQFNG